MTESGKSAQALTLSLLLILIIYFPLALWLRHSYSPLEEPNGTVLQLLNFRKIVPDGFGYFSSAQRLQSVEDTADQPRRSPILVYENDRPLGPAHSSLEDIGSKGQGRYVHTKTRTAEGIFFSTSDNSDPNSNGRHYWIVLPRGSTGGDTAPSKQD